MTGRPSGAEASGQHLTGPMRTARGSSPGGRATRYRRNSGRSTVAGCDRRPAMRGADGRSRSKPRRTLKRCGLSRRRKDSRSGSERPGRPRRGWSVGGGVGGRDAPGRLRLHRGLQQPPGSFGCRPGAPAGRAHGRGRRSKNGSGFVGMRTARRAVTSAVSVRFLRPHRDRGGCEFGHECEEFLVAAPALRRERTSSGRLHVQQHRLADLTSRRGPPQVGRARTLGDDARDR